MSGTTQVRGRFITLEGIEGVGKSTNLHFVAACVRQAGHDVVVTREPGGVPVAEQIRGTLLATHAEPVPPLTELLLMFAARAAHLEQLIRPALDAGRWVVCDRFTDASYAYQGGGRGLPEATIAALESMVHGDLRPDLTLLLDTDWSTTRARRHDRGVSDRFELEDEAFFQRVRSAYLARASRDATRIRVVDATGPLPDVQSRLRTILATLLQIT